ncbi:MAG: stage II sporulation protein M [Actinomycetota bacterium]|nr:stage II sporulation protein M [Actinomycetota bacterium]
MGTLATLAAWNAAPWPVLRGWLGGSLAITGGLLAAVLGVASLTVPDPTPVVLPGLHTAGTLGVVREVVLRNGLVLALHAMACVAGYLAGSRMPREAQRYTGWLRRLHDGAPAVAMAFVAAATVFSLVTQALALGQAGATLAAQLGLTPAALLALLLPHALPELVALFLPLAAWLTASHRGRADELLAATAATVALAAPVVVLAAVVEVYLTPRLLLHFV